MVIFATVLLFFVSAKHPRPWVTRRPSGCTPRRLMTRWHSCSPETLSGSRLRLDSALQDEVGAVAGDFLPTLLDPKKLQDFAYTGLSTPPYCCG
jgi:hypothetical protein